MKGVLVTGAGKRIGAAIAKKLGADGWFVIAHHNASSEGAEAVVGAIAGQGGRAATLRCDLSDADDVSSLVARCVALCDGNGATLSAIVNNASLFEYDDIRSLDRQSWTRHMDINLRAPVMIAQQFAQAYAGGDGCIVNMLDNKVFALNPDFFSYTISKMGLKAATEMLAMALAPRIRVCGVAPGITLISGKQTQQSFEIAHRNNPLGRGCSVEELGEAVTFCLTTRSFNGKIIAVDGGQSLQNPGRDVAFL